MDLTIKKIVCKLYVLNGLSYDEGDISSLWESHKEMHSQINTTFQWSD